MHFFIPWPVMVVVAIVLLIVIVFTIFTLRRLKNTIKSRTAQSQLTLRSAERSIQLAEDFKMQYEEQVAENAALLNDLTQMRSRMLSRQDVQESPQPTWNGDEY